MTDDLVKWLGEQLDEDERIARATTERQPYDQWDAVGDDREGETALKFWSVLNIASMKRTTAARDLATFIAAHDPARVLREIDAKRRELATLVETQQWVAKESAAWVGPVARLADTMLRLLALPYADRPGYREDWRP